MKKVFVALLAGLLYAAPSYAQTHPCDVTNPTTYREPSAQLTNLRVGFCHDGKDTLGNVLTGPIGFVLTIEGGPTIDLGVLPPQPVGVNAAGESYFATAPGVLTGTTGGTIRILAYEPTAGQSAPSPSVLLTLLGPPKGPRNTNIFKGGELEALFDNDSSRLHR